MMIIQGDILGIEKETKSIKLRNESNPDPIAKSAILGDGAIECRVYGSAAVYRNPDPN